MSQVDHANMVVSDDGTGTERGVALGGKAFPFVLGLRHGPAFPVALAPDTALHRRTLFFPPSMHETNLLCL